MKYSHESYGMVGFYRISGGQTNLFGSSVRHQNCIRLRISQGEKERDLKTNWFRGRGTLIEVDLSPTQFADAITAMNVGDGVPCTLRRVSVPAALNKGQIENCPDYDERKLFEDEFKSDLKEIMASATQLLRRAETLLSQKSMKAAERDELLGLVQKIEQSLHGNLPFAQECFTESMDKTVSEAKGEVEAFVQNKIVSLGIEGLREQIEGTAPDMPTRRLVSSVEKDAK